VTTERLLILVKHSLPEIEPAVLSHRWHLSAEGRRRCGPLAEQLATYRPATVVASREPKATETAALVAQRLGLPYETVAGLEENDRTGFTYTSAAQYEAALAAFFARPTERVVGGGTARAAEERFTRAIEAVLRSSAGGNVIVVAHGTVISLFVARHTGIEPFPFWRSLSLPSFVVHSLPDYRVLAVRGSIAGNTSEAPVPYVILIGPACAGKSTLARLLADRLHLTHVSLDGVAEPYYEECGLGRAVRQRLQAEQGFLATYRQWWPALAHATERLLAEHGRGVLDLGAGHTHYEDDHLFARVQRVLAPCPNVLLLLPSPDLDRSVRILRERSVAQRGWDWIADGYDFMERWVKDPCNHDLATLTVYTEGQTPQETCAEIEHQLRPSSI
jgi:broad specificity phosphatase PhoE